jgi:hypothetical protein
VSTLLLVSAEEYSDGTRAETCAIIKSAIAYRLSFQGQGSYRRRSRPSSKQQRAYACRYGQRLPKCGTQQVNRELAAGLHAELREALEPLLQEVESLNERIQEYDERMSARIECQLVGVSQNFASQ